jgi:predicted transposase/invertase (TIGR01784 family)
MANLWKNSAKQKKPRIPVIPIVLYHGTDKWNPGILSSRFQNLPDAVRPFVPDFEYIFVNLSAYSNEFIKKHLFTLASLRIAMLIMKNIFDQKHLVQNLGNFFELGRSIFQEKQGLNFLESVINYLYKATEIEIDTVVESIAAITIKGGEFAMSTADRLRQEGIKQGRQEGMQKAGNKMIFSLVRNAKKQGFPVETIAKIVDLDITLVKKILNNETIEIPLHLLDLENNH